MYSDFCCVRLFYVKSGRLKCSKNCVHWKIYHTVAACQNVVKMICQASYRNFDRAVGGTEVVFLTAQNSFTAWLITYLEASGLIMGFSYLQTSRSDVDIFYFNFYVWSNKRVWAV